MAVMHTMSWSIRDNEGGTADYSVPWYCPLFVSYMIFSSLLVTIVIGYTDEVNTQVRAKTSSVGKWGGTAM